MLEKVRSLQYSSASSFFEDLQLLRTALTDKIQGKARGRVDERAEDGLQGRGGGAGGRIDGRTERRVARRDERVQDSPLLHSFDTLLDCCELYLKARSAAVEVAEEEILRLDETQVCCDT